MKRVKVVSIVTALMLAVVMSVTAFAANDTSGNNSVAGVTGQQANETEEQYLERVEKAIAATNLNDYNYDYVLKNLTMDAITKQYKTVSYDYSTKIGDVVSDEVAVTLTNTGTGINLVVTGKDVKLDASCTTRTVIESSKDKVVSQTIYADDAAYKDYIDSGFPTPSADTGEKFVDSSFEDDAIIIRTKNYIAGESNQNTYDETFYYISVFDHALLAVGTQQVVDGKPGYYSVATNFKYTK